MLGLKNTAGRPSTVIAASLSCLYCFSKETCALRPLPWPYGALADHCTWAPHRVEHPSHSQQTAQCISCPTRTHARIFPRSLVCDLCNRVDTNNAVDNDADDNWGWDGGDDDNDIEMASQPTAPPPATKAAGPSPPDLETVAGDELSPALPATASSARSMSGSNAGTTSRKTPGESANPGRSLSLKGPGGATRDGAETGRGAGGRQSSRRSGGRGHRHEKADRGTSILADDDLFAVRF